jgi:hypothetical protein
LATCDALARLGPKVLTYVHYGTPALKKVGTNAFGSDRPLVKARPLAGIYNGQTSADPQRCPVLAVVSLFIAVGTNMATAKVMFTSLRDERDPVIAAVSTILVSGRSRLADAAALARHIAR